MKYCDLSYIIIKNLLNKFGCKLLDTEEEYNKRETPKHITIESKYGQAHT